MTTYPPNLRPVSTTSTLREYVAELRSRREFIASMPKHDLHAQNMDTVLGNLWYLVNPLLFTLVYYVIFGLLLNANRGVENYPVFLVIGVLVYNFFSQAVTKAAQCMPRNESLMRSLYFPRAAIPLTSALGSFYIFLPSVVAIVGLSFSTGVWPTWRWLLLPVIFVIAGVFVTGSVLLVARVGASFHDLFSLVPHVLRLLFYASGTLYDPTEMTDNATVLTLFEMNPLYVLISLCRWAVMGRAVPGSFWITSIAWAVVTLVVGFIFFWRGERTYGATR